MTGKMTDEAGIALFLVLWVLTLLSVIAGEFCFAMRTEVNIARNFKNQTEAYYIALAGMNRSIGEMIRNEVIPPKTTTVGLPGKEETPEEEEEKERWRINVQIPPQPYGGGEYEVWIGNESGKININGANEGLLKVMLNRFDLEEREKSVIVDSIPDWRDENNLHRTNGAEDDYYQSLPKPYECKDADFDSVEELLLVRGVRPEIFYGGLRDMVTVFKAPDRREKSPGGVRLVRADLNKVNINAAPKEVLLSLPSLTEDLVEAILNYRKESDFSSLTEITSLLGADVYNRMSPYITLETSPYFNISAVGTLPGSMIRQGVEALVEINRKLKKGYRVVQWRDSFQDREAPALMSDKE